MKRREFIDTFGKTTLAVATGSVLYDFIQGCSSKESSPKKQWNFVFVLADDLGWNQVRYEGVTKYYETPNIDRIAAAGMSFTDAYAADPVCSPSRASIMTGKYPARLHLTDYIPGDPYPYAKLKRPQQAKRLPLKEITMAEMLKRKGYVCGHFGKWHLNVDKNYKPGRPGDPGSQGFDVVFTTVKPKPDADPNKDAHHAVAITQHALKFIEEYKDKPFFAYVAHHVVHRPIMEHKDFIDKYRTKSKINDPIKNPIMGAMIERMDTGIGQILDKLDELNLTDKTIVIFYSDNGGLKMLQDQYPLRGGKAMVYEGGIRVPLAIKWPGVIKPGTKCSVPVISNDLFPTIAEMANVDISDIKDIDGLSLVPLLKRTGTIKRDALYWHYPHYHHQGFKPSGAIREGDYKLIEWYEQTMLGEDHQIDLYNIKKDIGETTNLANIMPEKAKEMREKFHQWKRAVKAQEMTINPNFDPKKQYLKSAETK
ncbi:MAG: sulfatase [Calditrichaeota bacterium]|nr:sulfatase [Calditrichota bacterium]